MTSSPTLKSHLFRLRFSWSLLACRRLRFFVSRSSQLTVSAKPYSRPKTIWSGVALKLHSWAIAMLSLTSIRCSSNVPLALGDYQIIVIHSNYDICSWRFPELQQFPYELIRLNVIKLCLHIKYVTSHICTYWRYMPYSTYNVRWILYMWIQNDYNNL